MISCGIGVPESIVAVFDWQRMLADQQRGLGAGGVAGATKDIIGRKRLLQALHAYAARPSRWYQAYSLCRATTLCQG